MIIRKTRNPFTAAIVVFLFLLDCDVEAGSLRVIAKYGDPAPAAGGTFRMFGQLNGVDPAISGENIAFGALAEEAAGIYAYMDGSLRVIADTRTLFPGSKEHFGFGLSYGSSPSISGQNVAFLGRSLIEGSSVWAYINGSLVKIADRQTPVPGGSGTFGSFHSLHGASPSISGENVAFTASSSDRNGIYARISGSLQVIADTNTQVPGQEGVTFMNFGQLAGTRPSISGENVAFAGQWSTGAGVYARINGELRFIADSTTTGGDFGLTGGGPSISGENVAFLGAGAIYAYISGKLRVIADTDTRLPGRTETFSGFSVSPVISGENVVFGSGAIGFGHAIFAYIDGSLQLIAEKNTPVPGSDTTFSNFFLQDGFQGEDVRPAISGENVVFTASPNGVYAYFPPTHGDFDDNDCLDLRDVAGFQRCFGTTTPKGQEPTPCVSVFDFDGNRIIDLTDYAALQEILTSP